MNSTVVYDTECIRVDVNRPVVTLHLDETKAHGDPAELQSFFNHTPWVVAVGYTMGSGTVARVDLELLPGVTWEEIANELIRGGRKDDDQDNLAGLENLFQRKITFNDQLSLRAAG